MTDLLGRIVILLARVLLGMDTIQAALLKLVNATDSTAIETIPKNIETIVTNTQLAVQNPTYGLAALRTAIDAIDTAVTVITPTPPAPPPSAGDNAAAIWDYYLSQQMPNGNVFNASAAEWLYMLGHSLAIYSATEGVPDGQQPFYRLVFGGSSTGYALGYNMSITTQARPDPPDFTQLLPTDNVRSFMQRTQPSYGWTGTGPSGVWTDDIAWKNLYGGSSGVWWRTAFNLPITPTLAQPPVWPGFDLVDLGTPVAISGGFTITEPMHGVIVTITAVAAKQMYYTYDDIRAYRHIGALAFQDDNGELETWQSLGFVSAVYCCRQMTVAAAVKVMSANGTVGTVTPWLRSS